MAGFSDMRCKPMSEREKKAWAEARRIAREMKSQPRRLSAIEGESTVIEEIPNITREEK